MQVVSALRSSSSFWIAFTSLVGAAQAQCADWEGPFQLLGPVGAVRAVLQHDDGSGVALYAGGDFVSVDGLTTRYLARWDGTQWSAIPGGVFDAAVYALAEFDDGSGPALFAAGAFTSIGSVPARGIAKWNGATWSTVGTNASEPVPFVEDLAVWNDGGGDALYATGAFASIGGVFVNHIAKWNGSSWNYLLGGLHDSSGFTRGRKLEVFDDGSGSALYVGGRFDGAGPTVARRVAKWDGLAWSSLGAGIDPIWDSEVRELHAFDDGSGARLFAGGEFTVAGGLSASNIASWNGSAWSPVGAGFANRVLALSDYDDGSGAALYAGGEFSGHLSRWTGSAWSSVGGGVNGAVVSLGVSHSGSMPELFVGGNFTLAGNVPARALARWDGLAWSSLSQSLGMGGGNVVAIVAAEVGALGPVLYAAGGFETAGSTLASNIAAWNGARWSPVGGGLDAQASALLLFDDGNGPSLVAAGYFTHAGGSPANGVARWDGSQWFALGSGLAGSGVALCDHDDGTGAALYVGGNFSDAGGAAGTRGVARWNGTSWSTLGGGLSSGEVTALASYDSGSGAELYASGNFSQVGGVNASYIARWNGVHWSELTSGPLHQGLNGQALALHVHDDGFGAKLWAGGTFTTAGGLGSRLLARWNGSSWSNGQMGSASFSSATAVYALASYDDGSGAGDQLIVGGLFTSTSGARDLARWNGVTWDSPGDVDGAARALASYRDPVAPWPSLFIGGTFANVAGSPTNNFARWSNPCAGQGASYCTAGITTNGCSANMSSSGWASRSQSSGFVVTVDDLEGAKSGTIFFGTNGSLAAPWGSGTSFRCVAAPTIRTGVHTGVGAPGTCDGVYTLDFNAWMQNHLAVAPPIGAIVHMQTWFRDPGNGSNKDTSFSDGLQFVVGP